MEQKINGEKKLKHKDKNFLIVNDTTVKYFKDLKDKIKIESGVTLTYNKILIYLLDCVDKQKFDKWFINFKEVVKGGNINKKW